MFELALLGYSIYMRVPLLLPVWYSDVDGTAVEKAEHKFSLQNACKRPLALVEKFPRFAEGVVRRGVPLGGFITYRPDIAQRHQATAESLATFSTSIPSEQLQVIHAGKVLPWWHNEDRKASRLIELAGWHTSFGFTDDKPAKIAESVVREMQWRVDEAILLPMHVVIGGVRYCRPTAEGVTPSPADNEYTVDVAEQLFRDSGCDLIKGRFGVLGVKIGPATLHISRVMTLDYNEGQHFAEQVLTQAVA